MLFYFEHFTVYFQLFFLAWIKYTFKNSQIDKIQDIKAWQSSAGSWVWFPVPKQNKTKQQKKHDHLKQGTLESLDENSDIYIILKWSYS